MPTSIKLSDTVNWAQPFVGWGPLNIGTANEPAITNANIVLQTMLGPPFRWAWNRFKQSFVANQSVQDIVVIPGSPPAVPTLSQVAGGSLAATTYYVRISYVNVSSAETLASAETSLAVSVNNVLQVASPIAKVGMSGYNVYVSTTTGTETKQNETPIAIGTAWTEPITGLITDGALPNLTAIGYFETASAQPAALITSTSLTNNVATYIAANKFTAGNTVTITGTTNGNGIFNVANAVILAATAAQFTVTIINANVTSASESGLATSGQIFPLELKNEALTEATEQDRPTFLSWQVDNNAGTVTFRVLPVPDQAYAITVNFQGAPTLFTATTQVWGIPDYLQYIYSYGFLYLTLDYFDFPQTAARYRQLFIATLLARAQGLSDMDKNLFLGNWLALERQIQNANMEAQQGVVSRGV